MSENTNEGDVGPEVVELEKRHKDAMLDLILAWAEFDTALGIFVTDALGLPLEQVAKIIGKEPASKKFRTFQLIAREIDKEGLDKSIGRVKKEYEKRSKTRRIIAHSKCIGVDNADRDRILFLPFEVDKDGNLILESLHIETVVEAINWAKDLIERMDGLGDISPIDD